MIQLANKCVFRGLVGKWYKNFGRQQIKEHGGL